MVAATQLVAVIQLPLSPIRAVILPVLQSRRPTLILAALSLSPLPSQYPPRTIRPDVAAPQPRRLTARPPVPLGMKPDDVEPR